MSIDLRLGDCLELMCGLEAGSMDMIFADPPFNVGKKYGGVGKNDKRADYYDWCERWIDECFRVLKSTGTLYLMTITRHLEKLYPMLGARGVFINHINWRNVSAARAPRSFWNESQPILMYGKTSAYVFNQYAQIRRIPLVNQRWGGYTTEAKGQLLDYWNDIPFVYAGSVHHPEAVMRSGTNEKLHPAQMPIALIERAIVFSTEKGDTVLEPFMGLGAGAIACWRRERNYIGMDCIAEYVDETKRRIAEAQLQMPMELGV